MLSYHKTHLFHSYGGQLWATLLACLGWIDAHAVSITNDCVSARITEANREPVSDADADIPGPQLSRRALAASQGQDMPAKRGVYHITSQAKQKRDEAKLADKALARHEWQWWAAHRARWTRPGDWWETHGARSSLGQGGCTQSMLHLLRCVLFLK